jgi:3-hydroxyisobutyrate dehydrogenase/glyoxylate/succinic semialdehyde reductase
MKGEKMKIGFIGLGIMGSRMALNLLSKGYELTVYNRTSDKAYSAILWVLSPSALAR